MDSIKTRGFRRSWYRYVILVMAPFLVIFAGCVGCPYSFTGASVPPHLESLAVPFAEDKSGSAEPGLRENFSTGLLNKFIEDNSFSITDRTQADAIIECVIVQFSDAPMVVNPGESVAARRITIGVQVRYRDLVKKITIYEKQFSNYGDYASSDGVAGKSSAIETALDKITDDILLETVSGW
ncbi:MAG: hypothetical protein AMXMBFR48_16800 [Ignavibacteriales bacterium]